MDLGLIAPYLVVYYGRPLRNEIVNYFKESLLDFE